MRDNFDFRVLKKAGFYSKEIKSTDYQAQAERVCKKFGLKNIYDYCRIGAGTRYHLTEDDHPLPLFVRTIPDNFADNILKSIIS